MTETSQPTLGGWSLKRQDGKWQKQKQKNQNASISLKNVVLALMWRDRGRVCRIFTPFTLHEVNKGGCCERNIQQISLKEGFCQITPSSGFH